MDCLANRRDYVSHVWTPRERERGKIVGPFSLLSLNWMGVAERDGVGYRKRS